MDPEWVDVFDVFPIENGDIPTSYVSLLEGRFPFQVMCFLRIRFYHAIHHRFFSPPFWEEYVDCNLFFFYPHLK